VTKVRTSKWLFCFRSIIIQMPRFARKFTSVELKIADGTIPLGEERKFS
jgi:hypothetical protein